MIDFKSRMKNYNKIFDWIDKEHTRLDEIKKLSHSNISLETRLKLIAELDENKASALKGLKMLKAYKIE